MYRKFFRTFGIAQEEMITCLTVNLSNFTASLDVVKGAASARLWLLETT